MVSDLCEVSFQKNEMSLSIEQSKERSLDALDRYSLKLFEIDERLIVNCPGQIKMVVE